MFYVYVLKSLKDGDFYIGSTSDLRKRYVEHNKGESKSTKSRAPFGLVYYEAYRSERDARLREQKLKYRGQARVHLMRRIRESVRLGES